MFCRIISLMLCQRGQVYQAILSWNADDKHHCIITIHKDSLPFLRPYSNPPSWALLPSPSENRTSEAPRACAWDPPTSPWRRMTMARTWCWRRPSTPTCLRSVPWAVSWCPARRPWGTCVKSGRRRRWNAASAPLSRTPNRTCASRPRGPSRQLLEWTDTKWTFNGRYSRLWVSLSGRWISTACLIQQLNG